MSVKEMEPRRKRLVFRSWHRGTREMDLILGSFANEHVPDFNEESLTLYEELLVQSDPDLYDWYIGKVALPDNLDNSVFRAFLNHKIPGPAYPEPTEAWK